MENHCPLLYDSPHGTSFKAFSTFDAFLFINDRQAKTILRNGSCRTKADNWTTVVLRTSKRTNWKCHIFRIYLFDKDKVKPSWNKDLCLNIRQLTNWFCTISLLMWDPVWRSIMTCERYIIQWYLYLNLLWQIRKSPKKSPKYLFNTIKTLKSQNSRHFLMSELP